MSSDHLSTSSLSSDLSHKQMAHFSPVKNTKVDSTRRLRKKDTGLSHFNIKNICSNNTKERREQNAERYPLRQINRGTCTMRNQIELPLIGWTQFQNNQIWLWRSQELQIKEVSKWQGCVFFNLSSWQWWHFSRQIGLPVNQLILDFNCLYESLLWKVYLLLASEFTTTVSSIKWFFGSYVKHLYNVSNKYW